MSDFFARLAVPGSSGTSKISSKKIKIGTPTINPHAPKKCSPNSKIKNVKKIGRCVLFDMNFGLRIYASKA